MMIFVMPVAGVRRSVDVQLPAPDTGGEAFPILLEVGPAAGSRSTGSPSRKPGSAPGCGRSMRGRPDRTIAVRGDGAARYQDVVAVIDSARGAGVLVVGLDVPRPAAVTRP
jgi:biopolymer transport protein ExbD